MIDLGLESLVPTEEIPEVTNENALLELLDLTVDTESHVSELGQQMSQIALTEQLRGYISEHGFSETVFTMYEKSLSSINVTVESTTEQACEALSEAVVSMESVLWTRIGASLTMLNGKAALYLVELQKVEKLRKSIDENNDLKFNAIDMKTVSALVVLCKALGSEVIKARQTMGGSSIKALNSASNDKFIEVSNGKAKIVKKSIDSTKGTAEELGFNEASFKTVIKDTIAMLNILTRFRVVGSPKASDISVKDGENFEELYKLTNSYTVAIMKIVPKVAMSLIKMQAKLK